MQTAQQFKDFTQLNEVVSGYKLTTLILRNGKKLNLKPAEVLVFSALATYWNGKPVYPRIKTLSNDTAQSEKTVRTAINGLLTKGYLIKSKTGKNANVYNINTNAVKSALKCGKNECISAVKSTAPCNIKSYHDKSEQQHVAVVNIKSFRGVEEQTQKGTSRTAEPVCSQTSFDLNTIPSIILNNPKVRNAQKYWGSLRPAVKIEYWQEQTKKDNIKKERAEREKAEAENKAREKAELQAELSKPLHEQWTKQQAIKHIWLLRNFRKVSATGLTADLINLYNLNPTEIWGMSAEEIEKEGE